MKVNKKFWKLGRADLNTEFFDINRDGELIVREGNYQYNVNDLADRFGTSLELVFPHIIEYRLQEIFNSFKHTMRNIKYRGKFYFHYPMKVNQNKEFVLPIISEGSHIETSSVNELWLVKRMWEQEQFSTKIKVLCNGPKTNRYLSLIEELKLKNLDIVPIIENHTELDYLRSYRGDVGIRWDPDVKVESHWDKQTDQFGFSTRQLLQLGKIRNLKIIHYHAGSMITKLDDLIAPVRKLMAVYIKMRQSNSQLNSLNLGGGFAVPYEKKRKLYTVDGVVKRIIKTIKSATDRAGIPNPDIIVEWGRWVVAPAQITVYSIIADKEIEKKNKSNGPVRHWYFIDGSFMNDLLDTWSIHQKWHMVPVNNMQTNKFNRVWLSGSSCDSDDKYTNGGGYVLMPRLEDLPNGKPQRLAIFDTGAYQDALASHHCLLSSPAKIIIQNGVITVARKRETPEDVGKQFGW